MEDEKALSVLVKLVKHFEGCYLNAYLCPAGVWTIGWGSTGKDIIPGLVWTQEQADERMMKDVSKFLIATKNLCPNLYGEKLGAISDFAYNLGATRLAGSTLRKRLLNEDWEESKVELAKWRRAGGKILLGLVRRREAESSYF